MMTTIHCIVVHEMKWVNSDYLVKNEHFYQLVVANSFLFFATEEIQRKHKSGDVDK